MPSPRKSCRWKSDGSSLNCADCGWITVDPEVIPRIACKSGFRYQIGDFDTLALRLHAELAASNRVASWLAIVSAWSRKLAS